uniref:PHD-type domain-containing protein n=1 Tax=Salix viminalis TaxID=40686 RepID=A0A6N2MLW5_SALVM
MTGGLCHRRKKMMGRGPYRGCGAEERPCRPILRVPAANSLVNEPEKPQPTLKKPTSLEVDFFSQANKVLSVHSPFDVAENASGSGVPSFSSVSTLPNRLASLLRQSDGSRKRHKKSHSGADKKSSSRVSDRSKGVNIWVEIEEYFRGLALPDIDALFEQSSLFKSLGYSKCFYTPYIGNEKIERIETTGTNVKTEENLDGKTEGNDTNEQTNTSANVENANHNVKIDWLDGIGKGLIVKDEGNQEDGQFMEIDSVATQSNGAECLSQEEPNGCSVSDFSRSVEWLLGCRNRNILTSERPSKKQKLLGNDAGLEKVLVGYPCEGNLSLCDFCCKGETGDDSNRLIVCSSCNVAVHLKCYGVQGDVNKSWLCSWCKQKSDENNIIKQSCVLCPKEGGAMKPVNVENGWSNLEFVHLFCSQWMPEVYIEDLMKMEPVMNVGGIKEKRRKLMCNVCKVKSGTCVQCSHGSCRTSFHPICAREARHRIEVWGKYGSDNVELRAFCLKHTGLPDDKDTNQLGEALVAASHNCFVASHDPSELQMDKQHKLNSVRNGDKLAVHTETDLTNSVKPGNGESREIELHDSKSDAVPLSESGAVDQLIDTGIFERGGYEGASPSDFQILLLILKKLIDQGKVNAEELTMEIGISSDLLIPTLVQEVNLVPDSQAKLVKWFQNHVHLASQHKDLKVKLKSTILPKSEIGTADHSDGITVSKSDITDAIAVMSVPPRRRTKSNIRILRDNRAICSPEEILSANSLIMNGDKVVDQLGSEEPENSREASIPNVAEKIPDVFQDFSVLHLPKGEDNVSDGSISVKIEQAHTDIPEKSNSINTVGALSVFSDVNLFIPNLIEPEAYSNSYVHPCIHEKLSQIQSGMLLQKGVSGLEGSKDTEISRLEASSNASVCCDHRNKHSKCNDLICSSSEINLEQLAKAKKLGILKLSPVDEVEGEIIYFQQRLLGNAVARKHFTDNLISKVARHLPQEIEASRGKWWDEVLVNQYLCDVREAKKQGRKERKHKEAQAVLAAATAAAAASSRTSSFRRDTLDESAHQEKYNTSNGKAGISSQLMPRPKEMLSRVAVPRMSSEKYSDFVQSVSDFSKDHLRSCDICRRFETILNPILVCSGCKVAVHLDCYRCVKESTGPWHCELCEELLSSRCPGAPANFWDRANGAECGLCGGITGAFRKSTDGRWVHAFCAECSAGHCQATFHPTCARSAGFYMNVKTLNGKMQHKAYCEKHSLEQKEKAETQKLGEEEIKSMRQGQLERLRLLCERIVRREKIKRELVLCSHSILACKRDQVTRPVLVRSPFFPTDASSESATTSLIGNTSGYKSCSDAVQRSDDVTVDSTISVKHLVKVPLTMDTDQKTDDSSTSQNLFTPKPSERMPFAGKQIPQRPSTSASHNLLDDGEWSSKSKHYETFEKELVMTSDEASMKNQKLPKGYFYIPVDCLPKEKQINQNACSGEPSEHNG